MSTQDIAPENTAAEATDLPETRADGKAYIDDDGAPCDDDKDAEVDDGSSVEMESSDDERLNVNGGWPEDPNDFDRVAYEELDEDAQLDWGVEDEDWELADGDFTKQYNRVRQAYGAADTPAGPSRSNAGPAVSRPLPARNANAARAHRSAPASAGTTGKNIVNPAVMLGGVAANPKSAFDRANQKDKADRATHEQVLDARTRLVLSALVNRGYFGVIDGVVSTGKEANVYLAYKGENPPAVPSPYPDTIAVKIYRTSILNFRARQNYIVGEHRFKGGYSAAKNPRKMVRLWAEKELRNLRRLVQGGVRAPIVIEQRENVLVMEFLGIGGTASPRLKDADISKSKLPRLYGEALVSMRRMYNQCKLVHADLSEYNILYHANHLYIIDVSQSVEHDHPSAFDFLRSDIRNIEDYFVKRSSGEVRTLGLRRAWKFIVDESVGLTREEEEGDEGEAKLLDVLRAWLDEPEPELVMGAEVLAGGASEGGSSATAVTTDGAASASTTLSAGEAQAAAAAQAKAKSDVDDAVFFSSYIPRSLGEVYDPERDVALLRAGHGDKLIYAGIAGLSLGGDKPAAAAAAVEEVAVEEPVAKDEVIEAAEVPSASPAVDATAADKPAAVAVVEDQDKPKIKKKGVHFEDDLPESEEDDDQAEDDEVHGRKSRGFRNEDKEANKERKKALKEEAREKRKNKMPKSEKARLIKKSSGRS